MVYANWAELAAAETLNVDYRLPIRYNRSLTACIAIHGGAIEAGSSEVASELAAMTRHNYYSLEGIKSSGNSGLHITSTAYDEPQAIALVASMDYCFSFHGMSDQGPGVAETYVGGLDTVYRDAVISALQLAGFTASIGTSELNGSSAQNIVNKTRRSMGVQLEMSNALRQTFFPGNDLTRANRETGVRTQTFYDYVRAIASVANDLGGGAAQTTNYRLNLAEPIDRMSDFETWLNTSWDKITDVAAPASGTTLPQAGPYKVGDRFYKTDTQSIYILICKDANWGWHWRPVHDAISPWVTIPVACMQISGWTIEKVAGQPFQIACDYRGNAHWRGTIGVPAGNTIPQLVSHEVFKTLPEGFRPRMGCVYMCGHETLSVSNPTLNEMAAWQGARISLPDQAGIDAGFGNTIRSLGGLTEFSTVYLHNVSYPIALSRFTLV